VHRIVPGFIVQGGDFVFGNGSGGESIFNGKKFKDERTGLLLKHDRKGILSMGNSGKNSNTSQFFITFGCAPQCDGKHVVFGEVLSGFEVLDELEKVGNDDGLPSVKVQITDCGVFHPLQTPGAGYWYDQPDKESYTGKEPVFIVKPRVLVVAPNRNVYEKFQNQMSNHVSSISIQLEDEENDVDAMKKVLGYLGNHAIDVVIVAPACSKMCKDLELPVCWKNNEGMRGQSILESEVIIIAKPVEALASILEMSWLSRKTDWKMYD
jgi:cyclophilin family peptidyl-prolyl cis-trans isomerase